MRALLFPLFLFAASAASAVTIEPMPGMAAQSARAGTFFQKPFGVLVRGDDGKPLAGATIEISDDDSYPAVIFPIDRMVTNAHGIAQSKVIAGVAGRVVPVARFNGVEQRLPAMTILRGVPIRLELVSGDDQLVGVGQAFPRPWKVRAVDASTGRAVPFAAVTFGDSNDYCENTCPHVVFPAGYQNGPFSEQHVMADASGIASSPHRHVTDVYGMGNAYACSSASGSENGCVFIGFKVFDEDSPHALEMVSWPRSVEAGAESPVPFIARVTNVAGKPLAGVEVFFGLYDDGMSWYCASFMGETDFEAQQAQTLVTNSDGIVMTPRIRGSNGTASCPTSVEWSVNTENNRVLPLITFRAEDVQIEAADSITVAKGQAFSIDVEFKVQGMRLGDNVYGLPAQAAASLGTNGATATMLVRQPTASYHAEVVKIPFKANAKAGKYNITVTRGPISKTIVVNQR